MTNLVENMKQGKHVTNLVETMKQCKHTEMILWYLIIQISGGLGMLTYIDIFRSIKFPYMVFSIVLLFVTNGGKVRIFTHL